jgi:hypothetical protein
LAEGGEGRVDLAFGCGLQDQELSALRARCFLRDPDVLLGHHILRVHQQRDRSGLRNQLAKQL